MSDVSKMSFQQVIASEREWMHHHLTSAACTQHLC